MKINKNELPRIVRLYRKDGLTMKQIGKIFGVGEHVVRYRLKKARVKARSAPPKYRQIPKARLEELYSDQRLLLTRIAAALDTDFMQIKRALLFHQIPEREPLSLNGKYKSRMRGLAIGERFEIEAAEDYPYPQMHQAARGAGIKISVKRIRRGKFLVTRIG